MSNNIDLGRKTCINLSFTLSIVLVYCILLLISNTTVLPVTSIHIPSYIGLERCRFINIYLKIPCTCCPPIYSTWQSAPMSTKAHVGFRRASVSVEQFLCDAIVGSFEPANHVIILKAQGSRRRVKTEESLCLPLSS